MAEGQGQLLWFFSWDPLGDSTPIPPLLLFWNRQGLSGHLALRQLDFLTAMVSMHRTQRAEVTAFVVCSTDSRDALYTQGTHRGCTQDTRDLEAQAGLGCASIYTGLERGYGHHFQQEVSCLPTRGWGLLPRGFWHYPSTPKTKILGRNK